MVPFEVTVLGPQPLKETPDWSDFSRCAQSAPERNLGWASKVSQEGPCGSLDSFPVRQGKLAPGYWTHCIVTPLPGLSHI